MRILITGGAGFVGSHLVDRLLREDPEKVIVLDRWLSEPMREHGHRANLEFIQGDTRDTRILAGLCQQVDIVYHLASILGTSETIDIYDPEEVAEVNILGTLRVLKASLAASVKRVIYPSTPDVSWLNPYKITKSACERFCQMYYREFGLSTVVLAMPNVYGPRERWMECDWGAPFNYQKVVPTFILKALKEEPLPVFGDGKQRSVYMHVDDVVEAMVLAGTSNGCEGQVIPLGIDEQVSVRELAKQVIRLTGSRSEIQYLPMRSGETKLDISVDTKVAEKSLGFTAQVGLSEGLEITIPHCRSLVDETTGA